MGDLIVAGWANYVYLCAKDVSRLLKDTLIPFFLSVLRLRYICGLMYCVLINPSSPLQKWYKKL